MRASARVAASSPILFLLGLASSTAVTFANADLAATEASREMGAWAAGRMKPAASTLESVRERLLEAQGYSPSDPSTQELLGILGLRDADISRETTESFAHFVRALALRPTSPYTWANLAEADYRQGNTGRRFLFALEQAVFLGPAEPEVQRMISDYGLAVWDELPLSGREAVGRAVGAGIRRNPLEMLQISERRGRLEIACRHLVGLKRAPDPQWYQLCPRTEATP